MARAAELLPRQGPLRAFVHHNTLHALQHLPFEEALEVARTRLGGETTWPEARYREELARGWLAWADVEAEADAAPAPDPEGPAGGDELLAPGVTRRALRRALLAHPPRELEGPALAWHLEDEGACRRLREDLDDASRRRVVAGTGAWARGLLEREGPGALVHALGDGARALGVDARSRDADLERLAWRDPEGVAAACLWTACQAACRRAEDLDAGAPAATGARRPAPGRRLARARDRLLAATGDDVDELVHPLLVRWCAAFVDQGLAATTMPGRERGLFAAWRDLLRLPGAVAVPFLRGLPRELDALAARGATPAQVALAELARLGVPLEAPPRVRGDADGPREPPDPGRAGPADDLAGLAVAGPAHHVGPQDDPLDAAVEATLLALPGWSGLVALLAARPEQFAVAPPVDLLELLALRLLVERHALEWLLARRRGRGARLTDLPDRAAAPPAAADARDARALRLFDAAQALGLGAPEVRAWTAAEARAVLAAALAFDGRARRRVWQRALERAHRARFLGALTAHRPPGPGALPSPGPPGPCAAQVLCCLDDREESLRRHLEELRPDVETLGAAGYFGLAIEFRGLDDAFSASLCPVVLRPAHVVVERPVAGEGERGARRRGLRRALAQLAHAARVGSRGALRGWAATLGLGLVSAFPLVLGTLFPRASARLRDRFARLLLPRPRTELTGLRDEAAPGAPPPAPGAGTPASGLTPALGFAPALGFTPDEAAERVARVLEDAGLVPAPALRAAQGAGAGPGLAPLVVVVGHGASSLNNPHASAYDCGACGGRRGGPNARLFAALARDPRVRAALAARGLALPAGTCFVGAAHDTTTSRLEWFDLEAVPATHREALAALRRDLDRAAARSAHERCRRFDSAPAGVTPAEALAHVEARAAHLAEPRPELGHATNALCVVGRRARTRGLFLDRRAFLVSYDPTLDPTVEVLARQLAAVVPVVAGINLEYYFSLVDGARWGAGTKLPHNVTALLGVMDGHASDLRTGLPRQMVEAHEPVRLLLVVEATHDALARAVDADLHVAELVRNGWLDLFALDPAGGALDPPAGALARWTPAGFAPWSAPAVDLPWAPTSADWYRGAREHLAPARIGPPGAWPGGAWPDAASVANAAGPASAPGAAPGRGGGRVTGSLRDTVELLAVVALGLPAAACLGLGAALLAGARPPERVVAALARATFGLSLVAALGAALGLGASGLGAIRVDLGAWFALGGYAFEVTLLVDRLSAPFVVLTTGLLGLVGLFSARYLHREPGFARFFFLLLLFATGMLVVCMAGSLDLLVVGWELVGLTSALLIGFFQARREPVRSALRAFAVYRVCDVGLLVAVVLLHLHAGTADFDGLAAGAWPEAAARPEAALPPGVAAAVAACLLVAAAGKAAQVPFSGWLPRAMEGPTPSSAIFYGALSIHAGAYLLLRMAPVLEQAPAAGWALVALGGASALHGTFVGRVQTDVKCQLAYASMAQVGLILVEVGLGLPRVALAHAVGHACLRTLQLLRAPSALQEHHALEAAWGGRVPWADASLEQLLPPRLRAWLYALALQRGHHDALLEWWVVRPALGALEAFDRLERRLTEGPPAPGPGPTPAPPGEGPPEPGADHRPGGAP